MENDNEFLKNNSFNRFDRYLIKKFLIGFLGNEQIRINIGDVWKFLTVDSFGQLWSTVIMSSFFIGFKSQRIGVIEVRDDAAAVIDASKDWNILYIYMSYIFFLKKFIIRNMLGKDVPFLARMPFKVLVKRAIGKHSPHFKADLHFHPFSIFNSFFSYSRFISKIFGNSLGKTRWPLSSKLRYGPITNLEL